ncbi:MAG TPA: rhomboid family intramembrane serine protease [Rubricoccaceae bacterium]
MPSDYRPPSAFSSIPPVVKNLLILNGLAFLAQAVFDWLPGGEGGSIGPVMWWGALWPVGGAPLAEASGVLAPAFYPWQLVTSAFLHGGIAHIAFNLFGLFMFGGVVERSLGSRRFAFFYLVSVLGASALQLAVVSAPFVAGTATVGDIFPTVGASGGVLGVMAAFGMLFPRERVFIFPLPVPIEARWFVLGYAALSLYAGVSGTGGNVAHFAHLGGMVAGALLLLFWRYQQRARRLA